MTLAFTLLATVAGLLALALWWIRRCNQAVPAEAAASPVAPACELGQQLLMASAAQTGASGSSGAGGGAPARKKQTGPDRRSFLRAGMGVGFLATMAGFGGASLAFLWPDLRGGFGGEITLPEDEDAILDHIRDMEEPYEYAPGRLYLIEYDPDDDELGSYEEITNGARLMALFWTCVHLGCKVPWCHDSQWLECPCHGSRYNRWGEWQGGPAPRGLDRFPLRVEGGDVIVDTGELQEGPPRGAPSLDQPPEGPSCV